MSICGILLLNKEQGVSSHAAMKAAQRLFTANKAGHGGTLDPLATGMLPIYFGEATKFIQYSLDADKQYQAQGMFGIKTDTGDSTGKIISTKNSAKPLDICMIENHIKKFTGEIFQTPPMYSAIKHNGQPLYQLARQGHTIERSSRKIIIKKFELLEYHWPYFTVNIECSKGTYIRTLLEDLAASLDLDAHMVNLHRSSVLGLANEHMHTLESLRLLSGDILLQTLYPVDLSMQHFPAITLDDEKIIALQMGKEVAYCEQAATNIFFRLYNNYNNFFGLISYDHIMKKIKAHRMMSLKY